MKRYFLVFALTLFALSMNFSAEAQFAMGETEEDTSLPVTLSTFTATASEGYVTLHWRTETEVGNVGFSIYRSKEKVCPEHGRRDGNYTKIAFIEGAGNSAMPTN